MMFTDTRLIALSYAEERGITPENSLYEGYTPFLPGHPRTIFNEFNENACIANFIILSSSMFGRYYREPDRYQKEILIYENIRNNNLLLVKFDPQLHYNGFSNKLSDILFYFDYRIRATDKTRLKGPVIEIYQVENCQYSDF